MSQGGPAIKPTYRLNLLCTNTMKRSKKRMTITICSILVILAFDLNADLIVASDCDSD
jgi:hypothetical protein